MSNANVQGRCTILSLAVIFVLGVWALPASASKPSPDEAIAQLQGGNERFVAGNSLHPNTGPARLAQAGAENQGDHAYATVITCSDSRLPVERLFDAGIMDLFVIRVAGNVCDTDEAGSIEYGLAHVNTPVLVVLGHTQCGAVTAVTAAVQGRGHKLERNIPPLVDNIEPAVRRAIAANPGIEGPELIEAGIRENVWQSIEDLFHKSPATRQLVAEGKVKVVGAIYDVGTGEVAWLAPSKTSEILAKVESDSTRAMNVYADSSETGESSGQGGEAAAGHAGGQSGSVSTQATKSKDAWVALLGVPGKFTAPGMTQTKRPAFGAQAGVPVQVEIKSRAKPSGFVVNVFWAITAATFLLTLFTSFRLAKITGQDHKTQRGFTLGSKLSLSMGGMATLILLVSTLMMASQDVITKDSHEYAELVAETKLLGGLELDVLIAQLNVKDFLGTHSDEELQAYSNYIASAQKRILVVEEKIKDPELMKLAKEIERLNKEYDERFAEVVKVIDESNGIVRGQLDPTGKRLTDVLHAIIETAQNDGDPQVALKAAEALSRLTLARVGVMKFLRTGVQADAEFAFEQVQIGEHELRQLQEQVQDPTRKKWLVEADEGYLFYMQRMERLIELVNRRHEIVKGELDQIGPQIVSIADELIESINGQENALQAEIDANIAKARIETVVISLTALGLALVITVLLVRTITRGIGDLVNRLKDIAQGEGDLTQRVDQDRKDELGELGKWFNTFVEKVHDIISEIACGAREVAGASTQIAASSEEMAAGMAEQASQVTQISSAVEQMSASVTEVSHKADEAADNASQAGEAAVKGGEVVEATIEGMTSISEAVIASAASVSELGKRGEQIGQIIDVINDIADQTNLLALNAAIEAARAGEHGRGFAVVADEVRKLADRTTKATEEIGESISAIQTETDQAVQRMNCGTEQVGVGVTRAKEAGDSLREIVASSRGVAEMIRSIAAAAEEQSAASEQISRNIESISAVTSQATEGASQSAAAASQLSSKAEQLQQIVSQFKLHEGLSNGK